MPAADKTIQIGIEFDRASQEQFLSSTDALASKLNNLSDVNAKIATSSDIAGRSLKQALQGVESAADAGTASVDDLRQSLVAAEDAAEKLQDASGGGGGSFGVEGLRRTGGALTQLGLGDIGQPVQRIGDLGQVIKEVGQISDAAAKPLQALPGFLGDVAAEGTALGGSLGAVIAVAGPLVLAIGAIAVAFKVFISDTIEKGTKDLEAAIDSQVALEEKKKTLTTEAALKEYDALKAKNDAISVIENRLVDQFNAAVAARDANSGNKTSPEYLSAIATIAILQPQIDKLTASYKTNADSQGVLEQAILNGAFAANDAAEAQKKLTDANLAAGDAEQKKTAQLFSDSNLTSDAAKKRVDSLSEEREGLLANYNSLVASGDTSDAAQAKMKLLSGQIQGLSDEIENLTKNVIPAAKATEDDARATERSKKAHEDEVKAREEQDAKIAGAVEKYNNDVVKIEDNAAQQRVAIATKLSDALIAAAQKALEVSQDALRKLNEQQDTNAINFARGEVDAEAKAQYDRQTVQVKAQQEEVKAYQDHLDKLQDIRRNAQLQEANDILNRNFLGLFQSKMSENNAIAGENQTFGRSQRDKQAQEQQTSQDNARQLAFEHQQRLVAYERQNEDAQRQYQIQLQQIDITEQRARAQARQADVRALSDLEEKTKQELQIRHAGIVAELKLVEMGEQQKLVIQANYLKQAQQLLQNAITGGARQITTNAPHIVVNNVSHVNNVDPRALAQANALQTLQMLRKVTGAGQ